jgi:hypothetical protein
VCARRPVLCPAGKVAFHTPQQQHSFNFPFQIGSADSMSDPPSSAQRFEVRPSAALVKMLADVKAEKR